MTAETPTPIAHGQRVAGETVHTERPDGHSAVSFRLPLGEAPEPQMTVEADRRRDADTAVAPADVGLLAEGPGVWEAVSDDEPITPGSPR